jgi:hypothetical protein
MAKEDKARKIEELKKRKQSLSHDAEESGYVSTLLRFPWVRNARS